MRNTPGTSAKAPSVGLAQKAWYRKATESLKTVSVSTTVLRLGGMKKSKLETPPGIYMATT